VREPRRFIPFWRWLTRRTEARPGDVLTDAHGIHHRITSIEAGIFQTDKGLTGKVEALRSVMLPGGGQAEWESTRMLGDEPMSDQTTGPPSPSR
jgi:hypothetical protein